MLGRVAKVGELWQSRSMEERTTAPARPARLPSLDGLRGIAALAVTVYHARSELWVVGLAQNPQGLLSRAYLAVDFFFMLSGFVIAAAYEERMLAGMSLRQYALIRLRRLYPILQIGTLLGVLAMPFWHWTFNPWLAFVGSVTLIPFLGSAAVLYDLNVPAWSIAYELVANAAHFLFVRRLTLPVLAVVLVIGALGTVYFGLRNGNLNLGWNRDVAGGVVRTIFGFSLGLLAFRLPISWVPKVPAWCCGLVLAVLLALPRLSGIGRIQDMLVVLLAFPPLLVLSIRSVTGPAWLTAAFRGLGRLSYPLYAVHFPILIGAAGIATSVGHPVTIMSVAAGIAVLLAVGIDRFVPVSLGGSALPAPARAIA